MAVTTEFTQAQVDSLTRAIGLGVLEVEHNGKRTRYQSITDMLNLRDRMKTELAAVAAAAANAAAAAAAIAAGTTVPCPTPMPCMTRRTAFVRRY